MVNATADNLKPAGKPAKARARRRARAAIPTTSDNGNPLPLAAPSLLDFFAAHAPAGVLWSFDVAMPTTRPEEVMRGEGHFCYATNAAEIAVWDDERDRQRAIQWPWVWAETMLAERARRSL